MSFKTPTLMEPAAAVSPAPAARSAGDAAADHNRIRRKGQDARPGVQRPGPDHAAHPDQAWIETPAGQVAVTPQQPHRAEHEAAWQQITTAAPRFAKYQQATDRELPIIRLVPCAS